MRRQFTTNGVALTQADKAYFVGLQHAILTDDEKWISKELCFYPFTVNLASGTVKIRNDEELKKQFKRIFDAEMKKVVRNQSPDSLFKNWQGLMVGDGEIWFGEIGVTNGNKMDIEYRILAISVPPIKFEAK
jgi:hypothetical protein